MGVEAHKGSPLEWVLKDAQKFPKRADGKAFSGRGYNGTGLEHKRMETESCSFYLVIIRPSAGHEWSHSTVLVQPYSLRQEGTDSTFLLRTPA